MSIETGIAGTTPYARRQLVELEHPYSKIVFQAIQAAFEKALQTVVDALIVSAYSPIPKETGYLRTQTTLRMTPSQEGVQLTLSWPNVPYARILIEHAGEWQFAHEQDPAAVGDFPEPSMRIIFEFVLGYMMQELDRLGIQYTLSGAI